MSMFINSGSSAIHRMRKNQDALRQSVTGSNREKWLMTVSDRECVYISLTEQGKNII